MAADEQTEQGHILRYLTDAEKRIELLEFRQRCTPDWDGLASLPDPAMVPYLLELNRIPGLCTLQSCSGHVAVDPRDGSEYITGGHLWLWSSRAMMKKFYSAALGLAQHPEIERLRILFQAHGREIVDIEFQGAAHGELATSMGIIIGFFTDCAGRDDEADLTK